MGIKQKSFEVRYLTYWLIFPGDKRLDDFWVKQTPFIHDLQFEMQNWKGLKHTFGPDVYQKLLTKGEATAKDTNGVEHRVVIEDKERQERWGIQRN